MPPEKKATVLRVRTFADDIKRAEGGAPTHLPGASAQSPSHSLADALAAHVDDIAERPKTPVTVPTDTTPPQRTQDHFDIRRAESDGMEEGTIIQDRKEKEWSFFDALKTSTETWWATRVQPLFEKKSNQGKADIAPLSRGPKTIVAPDAFTIAPRDDHGALLKNIRGNEEHPLQKEVTPQTPAPAIRPPAPITTGWRRISEPREGTAVSHTTSEEARTYKEDLRRALPQKNTISPSLKTSAPLRSIPRTDIVAKNTAPVAPDIPEREATLARERLAALAHEAAASVPQPKRVSRDIPFIPPKLTRT